MFKRMLGIAVALVLIFSGAALAAEGYVWSVQQFDNGPPGFNSSIAVTVACTAKADASVTASLTSTDLHTFGSGGKTITQWMKGGYLYYVTADLTVGGTAATDNSDLVVLDSGDMDLLGSPDGGTTPYAGANIIHSTLKRGTLPYQYNAGLTSYSPFYHQILGPLTFDVTNNAVNDATFTLTFYVAF